MEDKCPFCGSEKCHDFTEILKHHPDFIEFACGTSRVFPKADWKRTCTCYESQVANLQAKVAAMREVLQEIIAEVDDYEQRTGDVVKSWPPKARKALSTASAGEWVSVRREDLEMVMFGKGTVEWKEAHDRLKAALGTSGEE